MVNECNFSRYFDMISRSQFFQDLSYAAPELREDGEYVIAKIGKAHAVEAIPVEFIKMIVDNAGNRDKLDAPVANALAAAAVAFIESWNAYKNSWLQVGSRNGAAMKKVEEVAIALENCEEIILPIQAFGRIEMDGIHKVVSRVGLYDVLCLDVAGDIAIEITPKANQLGTIKPEPAPYGNVFERLTSYCDIVSIEFRYDNGETFEVYVEYDPGDNDAVGVDNLNQKYYISENGSLYIVISDSGNGIDDYFDREIIDSKDYKTI